MINLPEIYSQKTRNYFIPILIIIKSLIIVPSVLANCADSIASLELVKAPMERRWQQLQQVTNYPWGSARPYGQMFDNKIILTPEFEQLTREQKQQVLATLLDNWYSLLTEEEKEQARVNYLFGSMSPYQVYASDGRIVSMPYDGCTRMTLLTERDRFSWYLNRPLTEDGQIVTAQMLRNAGKPLWRKVNYSISPQDEENVRLKFWHTVGYDQAHKGWWIAWVPEHGYFEINVPSNYETSHLNRFLSVAPRSYRYLIIADDGTMIPR